jgi:hypothetical protein
LQDNKSAVWYYENDIKEKRNKSRDAIEYGGFHIPKCPGFSPEHEKESVNSMRKMECKFMA